MGYTESITGCIALTNIVSAILNEAYGLTIRSVAARNTGELYYSIAHKGDEANWFDFTVCGSLPDDSDFLRQHDDKVTTVGGSYAKMEEHRWYMIISRTTFEQMRRTDSCTFEFFDEGISTLRLDDVSLPTLDAAQWLTENVTAIGAATTCSREP